jgi:hypothetical protein
MCEFSCLRVVIFGRTGSRDNALIGVSNIAESRPLGLERGLLISILRLVTLFLIRGVLSELSNLANAVLTRVGMTGFGACNGLLLHGLTTVVLETRGGHLVEIVALENGLIGRSLEQLALKGRREHRSGLSWQVVEDCRVLYVVFARLFFCFVFWGTWESSEILIIIVADAMSKELFILVLSIGGRSIHHEEVDILFVIGNRRFLFEELLIFIAQLEEGTVSIVGE